MSGTTNTNTTSTGSNTVNEAGSSIKGVFAAVHGAGEALRGSFNGAVDNAFNSNGGQTEGVARNDAVTKQGLSEMDTGKFSSNTKHKETTKDGSGI